MQYLLVIDMQEDYLGVKRNKKRYPYDTIKLIKNINERINEYPDKSVIYITNRFFWELGKKPKTMVNGLNIVSDYIYQKRRKNAFSIRRLQDLLHIDSTSSIELVGIDGNLCVGTTALEGVKMGFRIIFNESCIGIRNPNQFKKFKTKLTKAGVEFI